jgi:hypothetical protein
VVGVKHRMRQSHFGATLRFGRNQGLDYSNRLTTGTVWPGWQDDSSMWNGWWSRRRNARWFSNGGCA